VQRYMGGTRDRKGSMTGKTPQKTRGGQGKSKDGSVVWTITRLRYRGDNLSFCKRFGPLPGSQRRTIGSG